MIKMFSNLCPVFRTYKDTAYSPVFQMMQHVYKYIVEGKIEIIRMNIL